MEGVTFDKELKLPAAAHELDKLLAWLEAELATAECPAKAANQLCVAAEELFVNIAKYAYKSLSGGDEPAREAVVRAAAKAPFFYLQFEDGGSPFNPLEHPEVDTGAGIDERKIGGLGIHIIMKWMDEVSYARENDRNIVTLRKKYKEEG
jgi:sigma-B regulation protein RsbU (phosphoserine phosphatase)